MKEDTEQNDWFGAWMTRIKTILLSLSYDCGKKTKVYFYSTGLISTLNKFSIYHNPLCNDQE